MNHKQATRRQRCGETGGGYTRDRTKRAAKESKIYIDGKFYAEADAKVSVFDHGLLYGDGIFEGIRFYNGRVFRLEEHLDRSGIRRARSASRFRCRCGK